MSLTNTKIGLITIIIRQGTDLSLFFGDYLFFVVIIIRIPLLSEYYFKDLQSDLVGSCPTKLKDMLVC